MDTPVFKEPLLGYYPCCIGFLTGRRRAVDGTVRSEEHTSELRHIEESRMPSSA